MGWRVAVAAGVVMLLLGGLWTFQGLGYVGGSFMSGSETWTIIGSVVAGLDPAFDGVAVHEERQVRSSFRMDRRRRHAASASVQ